MARTRAELFKYHPPKGNQTERYEKLRAKGLELALLIDECCPDTRERAIAQTELESVIMRANQAIAVNE